MRARVRAVIDTNIVFEGLTHRGGPAGVIVNAWMAELFQSCVSQASWRPSSPDPGDEHVIDCAMNARAIVVTSNLRDFELARVELHLPVLSPVDFLTLLQAETRGS
jgi:predicted nucleic acid-binding protein